jgi:hypothetical protein
MMDGNGNCRPFGLAAGDEARGSVVREAAVAAMGRGGATVVAPLSSKRRSSPRSNPANFDLKMFDMANYAIPVFYKINKTLSVKQEPCHSGRNCPVLACNFPPKVYSGKFAPPLGCLCPRFVLLALTKRLQQAGSQIAVKNHCESCLRRFNLRVETFVWNGEPAQNFGLG